MWVKVGEGMEESKKPNLLMQLSSNPTYKTPKMYMSNFHTPTSSQLWISYARGTLTEWDGSVLLSSLY